MRLREKNWLQGTVINLIGAYRHRVWSTVVVAVTKFYEGAWMVLILIPVIIGDVPHHSPALPMV